MIKGFLPLLGDRSRKKALAGSIKDPFPNEISEVFIKMVGPVALAGGGEGTGSGVPGPLDHLYKGD